MRVDRRTFLAEMAAAKKAKVTVDFSKTRLREFFPGIGGEFGDAGPRNVEFRLQAKSGVKGQDEGKALIEGFAASAGYQVLSAQGSGWRTYRLSLRTLEPSDVSSAIVISPDSAGTLGPPSLDVYGLAVEVRASIMVSTALEVSLRLECSLSVVARPAEGSEYASNYFSQNQPDRGKPTALHVARGRRDAFTMKNANIAGTQFTVGSTGLLERRFLSLLRVYLQERSVPNNIDQILVASFPAPRAGKTRPHEGDYPVYLGAGSAKAFVAVIQTRDDRSVVLVMDPDVKLPTKTTVLTFGDIEKVGVGDYLDGCQANIYLTKEAFEKLPADVPTRKTLVTRKRHIKVYGHSNSEYPLVANGACGFAGWIAKRERRPTPGGDPAGGR